MFRKRRFNPSLRVLGKRAAIGALIALMVVLASLFFINILTPAADRPDLTTAARVVGLVRTPAEDTWKDDQFNQIEAVVKQHGYELMVLKADRTQASQIQQLRALLVYQVDVIIFSPLVESGWTQVLDEAQQAGIEVIAVDEAIRDENGSCHHVVFAYEDGAAAMLRTMNEDDRLNGDILELVGPVNANTTRALSRGYRLVLDRLKRPIKYSYSADRLASYATEITAGALQNVTSLAVILAQNEAMTEGAWQAVKDIPEAVQNITLAGLGGGENVLAMHADGRLDYLLVADNKDLAAAVSETISALAGDRPEKTVIHAMVPLTLLTPETRDAAP